MCCHKEKQKLFHFSIIFLILLHFLEAKVVDKNNCPLIDSKCDGQPSLKPQPYQSNSVLKVTPKIQVPLELTSGVDTGFTISLPIQVKFQSPVELMTDWMKHYLTTKTNGLTKNFNSFSASLTQLLGILNPSTNADPNSSERHSGHSSDSTKSVPSASDSTSDIDSDSNTSAADSSEPNLSDGNPEHKDSHKLMLQNRFANDSRVQARNFLFKSIEVSHSTLGKSCLLRAVCEVSQTPMMAPNTGIIGQIIDMFLTIDSFHESLTDFEDYFNAQTVGRNSLIKQSGNRAQNSSFLDDCRLYYGNDCPFSLFNINHIIPLNV